MTSEAAHLCEGSSWEGKEAWGPVFRAGNECARGQRCQSCGTQFPLGWAHTAATEGPKAAPLSPGPGHGPGTASRTAARGSHHTGAPTRCPGGPHRPSRIRDFLVSRGNFSLSFT